MNLDKRSRTYGMRLQQLQEVWSLRCAERWLVSLVRPRYLGKPSVGQSSGRRYCRRDVVGHSLIANVSFFGVLI